MKRKDLAKDLVQIPVNSKHSSHIHDFFYDVLRHLRQDKQQGVSDTLGFIHLKWDETLRFLKNCETEQEYQFYQLLCLYQHSFDTLKDEEVLDTTIIYKKVMACYTHLYSAYELLPSENNKLQQSPNYMQTLETLTKQELNCLCTAQINEVMIQFNNIQNPTLSEEAYIVMKEELLEEIESTHQLLSLLPRDQLISFKPIKDILDSLISDVAAKITLDEQITFKSYCETFQSHLTTLNVS